VHKATNEKKAQPKVVFISPTASQPRYHKRASQLSKFCEVDVFSFRRGYYEENTFPPYIPAHSLGYVSDGRYFRRISSILSAVRKIRYFLRDDSDCLFYAMSFDCLMLARLCGIRRGFYEIGDLRQAEGLGRVFAIFERVLFRRVLGLVLTSRYFYNDFYRRRKLLPQDRVYVIDNKLNHYLADKRPEKKVLTGDRIVIGLVGLLRYLRPIELLLEFVKARPNRYVLECFGDGPLKTLVVSCVCENIRYHGSFKNPEEIPGIYKTIDLNYTVYDNSSRNVALAIPNKIFESAFFGVPIVCCEGTAVGKMAKEWGIGRMLRISSRESFEEDLEPIGHGWLEEKSRNCFKIPSSELLDDGEEVLRVMLGTYAVGGPRSADNLGQRYSEEERIQHAANLEALHCIHDLPRVYSEKRSPIGSPEDSTIVSSK